MGSAQVILLDTHALVWMDTDASALGRTARRLIRQAWEAQQLAVSVISFWECAMLHARGRIVFLNRPWPGVRICWRPA